MRATDFALVEAAITVADVADTLEDTAAVADRDRPNITLATSNFINTTHASSGKTPHDPTMMDPGA